MGREPTVHDDDPFRHCPRCAARLESFDDDGVARRRCPGCGWVRYRNPTVGVAVVLQDGDGCLLLGRRAGGGWCIPCGHVEWNESTEDAARRELAEETGLEIALDGVLAVHSNFHDPAHHTVGVWYRGRVTGGTPRAGGDLVEIAFHPLDAPPPLAFPTDARVIAGLAGRASRGSDPTTR
ncbi:MAG: NUDIX domain-containing protein [Candidatus Eiseniibacteriota bacterium]|jgi:ADP-ribose pyrophosphatase YjhB (NUDIX family)